ncbi:MAG: hypothetical protein IKC34_00535 [Clostridia bacterium]|nr:hypothetical protein [Clostridia bacterium]
MQRKTDRDAEIDEKIRELELKKLEVKQKIEEVLSEIAEESGIKSIKNRKYDVGLAPNDWSEEENI